MSWQLGIFLICSVFLVMVLFMYLAVKLSHRRLKRSKYGHTFDFSQMPNRKIVTSTSHKRAG